MTIRLDHTIVPAKDRKVSAEFFADVFGLTVKRGGYFAQVRVNESLTLDFSDDLDEGEAVQSQHYAFHVSDVEYEAILGRVKARGIAYGSEPDEPAHTAGSTPVVAGAASTSRIRPGTCWR